MKSFLFVAIVPFSSGLKDYRFLIFGMAIVCYTEKIYVMVSEATTILFVNQPIGTWLHEKHQKGCCKYATFPNRNQKRVHHSKGTYEV